MLVSVAVDDILTIFHQTRITEEELINGVNSLHHSLEFKFTHEEQESINFLDISVIRKG